MADNVRVSTRIHYNNIPSIVLKINSESQRVAYDTARSIAAGARQRAPVRTGYLKRSIEVIPNRPGFTVQAGAPYAAFVEYGTATQRARPFMRPSVETSKQSFLASLIRAIQSFVHR